MEMSRGAFIRTALARLSDRVRDPGRRRGIAAMAVILGLAAFLRFFQISDNYFHALDTTAPIAGLEALFSQGTYPYTSYGPPGNGLSVAPFLFLGGYSFWPAQIGIALYGVGTVLAVFMLARRLAPEMTIAPYLAALLVAVNPLLVASSRVLFFDAAQVFFLTVYLLLVLSTERGTRRRWLIPASYAVGFILVLMRTPYVLVVGLGTVYLASGLGNVFNRSDRQRSSLVWLAAAATGFVASLLAYLAIAPIEAQKITTASEGQFFLQGEILWNNAKILALAWANPVNTPATSIISARDDVPVSAVHALLGLLVFGLAALGMVAILGSRRWDGLFAAAVVMVLILFYLPYVNWRENYALPGLIVLLTLVAIGAEHALRKRKEILTRRRLVYSLAISVYLLALAVSVGGSLARDSQMLRQWNTSDSLIDNNILMFPQDREAITGILRDHPDAFVVSTMASFVSIADGPREREMLDLFVFGRERKNSSGSLAELKAALDEELAQGGEVLYLPWWFEIESAREGLENSFKMYLDFILSSYDVRPLYKGVNIYRNKVARRDAVPTTLVYEVVSPIYLADVEVQPVSLGAHLRNVPTGLTYREDVPR
jgi:4-amino-4-deoxy-L-arabinose transferase-like glycosyltransferase